MRILLVVDGSSYSDLATNALGALKLSPEIEVTVMTVVPEYTFRVGINLGKMRGNTPAKKKSQQEKASELLQGPIQLLNNLGLKAESVMCWGNPAQVILRVAKGIDASLIVMGAKGLTDSAAFRLGSVSETVMKQAKTSVLLVRKKVCRINRDLVVEEKTIDIKRVLFATDGSKYADRAGQFLRELPLPLRSQIVLVIALQSHVEAFSKTPTLDFETNTDLLSNLQKIEEGRAKNIVARSEEEFKCNGYNTISLIMKGGALESILKAAEQYDPDLITLGSRGLTGIRLLFLGSVAEGVARYATCSVLIVK